MRHIILILVMTTMMVALAGIGMWLLKPLAPTQPPKGTSMMTITSTAFSDGQDIPSTYTCDGADISPEILISPAPVGTKSLAITVTDPDSPSGTWIHWTAWNLAPSTTRIPEGARGVDAIEGTTTFGDIGYGGPCPGRGKHRYIFTVYALDRMLDLSRGASYEDLMNALHAHVVDQGSMTGLYQRDRS